VTPLREYASRTRQVVFFSRRLQKGWKIVVVREQGWSPSVRIRGGGGEERGGGDGEGDGDDGTL
jgi:hypothetical protein